MTQMLMNAAKEFQTALKFAITSSEAMCVAVSLAFLWQKMASLAT